MFSDGIETENRREMGKYIINKYNKYNKYNSYNDKKQKTEAATRGVL